MQAWIIYRQLFVQLLNVHQLLIWHLHCTEYVVYVYSLPCGIIPIHDRSVSLPGVPEWNLSGQQHGIPLQPVPTGTVPAAHEWEHVSCVQ